MKIFTKVSMVLFVVSFVLGFTGPMAVFAATTPSLGLAATYGVLGSTYTNTVAGTTINGDVGFTTGPAVAPLGTHTNYGPGAPYATAGTDQGSALTNLNSQACTFTFANGAIDLATDTTHGPIGVYTPGVYCTGAPGAASIGTAGITLSGAGTYIFRINGALTSVANSVVTLAGASACDVFWTPTAATTLGANSTFVGTNIDASGITVGSTVTWAGRALAFGGTVSTTTDTITVPTCAAPPTTATLHVVKTVINNNGGSSTASSFNLHVKLSGTDVAGSPAVGVVSPGRSYTLAAGTYVVSEDTNASYTQSFSGACDSSGSVTLASGADVTCTITNDDIAALPTVATLNVIKHVVNNNGGMAVANAWTLAVSSSNSGTGIGSAVGSESGTAYTLQAGKAYSVAESGGPSGYSASSSSDCTIPSAVAGTVYTCTITNDDIAPGSATLHVIKYVVNDNGGTAISSSFNLHVKLSGTEVTGSPAVGVITPGRSYTLAAGTYVVSEDTNTSYAQSFSGDCNLSGSVTLASGDSKTCTITNNDIAVVPPTPKLPNAGFGPDSPSTPWNVIIPTGIFVALFAFFLARKKLAI